MIPQENFLNPPRVLQLGGDREQKICSFRGTDADSQHEKPNIRRKQRVSVFGTPYFRFVPLPEIAVHLNLIPFNLFEKTTMKLVVLMALSAGISSTDRTPFKIFLVVVDPKTTHSYTFGKQAS